MKVVITSATSFESEVIKAQIEKVHANNPVVEITFHVSGIGMLASCYSITKLIVEQQPELIIQVGIAGSFDTNVPLGTVVIVKDEVTGDLGVEENETFIDLFDMNFLDESEAPFTRRKLVNPWLDAFNLLHREAVSGLTVNEISTRKERIKQLERKYGASVESMEGAALHYACLQMKIPFLQVRGISNYVGERNKNEWQLVEAIKNLSADVLRYLDALVVKKISV